jgi:hypothetical protein
MEGSCNCVGGVDPEFVAVTPSDRPFKYKREHSPLQTTSLPASFPILFFQRSLIFHIIAKMASAET